MTLREVLQIELWSRETSRRILRSIWKVTKPVVAVLGVLILLVGITYTVESRWLTSGERKAGLEALAKIEELQQIEGNVGVDFNSANGEAKGFVAVAQQKALTLRDKRAAGLLELFRWELETDHESRVRELEGRALYAERHLQWHSNPVLDRKIRETQASIYGSMSSLLHKELD
jgi:hypothetical protein